MQFAPPSLAHWLGTDEFGRDVLTRLIYGARIALFIGLVSSFLGAMGGAVIGVFSAYLGGKTDLWLQRLMDILLAFPLLVLALAIVAVLGRSIPVLWYLPEYKIFIISTTYTHISLSQNIERASSNAQDF